MPSYFGGKEAKAYFRNKDASAMFGGVPILNKVVIGEESIFAFDGTIRQFECKYNMWYKFETYGAQGGDIQGSLSGTNDTYTRLAAALADMTIGYKLLTKGTIIYICVGGKGLTGYVEGGSAGTIIQPGFNSQGTGVTGSASHPNYSSSGGGGSHIALVTGLTAAIAPENILISSKGSDGNHAAITFPPPNYTGFYTAWIGAGGAGGGTDNINNVANYLTYLKSITAGVRSGNGLVKITTFAAA